MAISKSTRRQATSRSTKKHHTTTQKTQNKKPITKAKSMIELIRQKSPPKSTMHDMDRLYATMYDMHRLYDMVKEQENIHFNLYKKSHYMNRMIGDEFVVYFDLSKKVEHAIQSHTDIETLRREVLEEKTKRINNPGDYATSVSSYVRAATWFTDACDILLI